MHLVRKTYLQFLISAPCVSKVSSAPRLLGKAFIAMRTEGVNDQIVFFSFFCKKLCCPCVCARHALSVLIYKGLIFPSHGAAHAIILSTSIYLLALDSSSWRVTFTPAPKITESLFLVFVATCNAAQREYFY